MKTRLALFTLLLACSRAAADDSAASARIAALRESFRFVPIAPAVTSLASDNEPVVVLERLTITDSMSRRALATKIEEGWAREAAAAFTWKKGGLLSSHILGGTQADVGVWVTIGEKTLGANPSRAPFIKVEFLRIKW